MLPLVWQTAIGLCAIGFAATTIWFAFLYTRATEGNTAAAVLLLIAPAPLLVCLCVALGISTLVLGIG